MLKLYYTKTIDHYLFKDMSTESLQRLIDKFCQFYDLSLKQYRKIWSNEDYINSVVLSFLSIHNKIIDRDSVFLALLFKYAYADDYVHVDVTVFNVEYFLKFVTDFELEGIQQHVDKVLFLLQCDEFLENDVGVCETDFYYYQDILMYCQPIIYFPSVYTCYYHDEEYKIVNHSHSNYSVKDKETLSKGLIKILGILQEKTLDFNSSVFTEMHHKKVEKLQTKYKGIL